MDIWKSLLQYLTLRFPAFFTLGKEEDNYQVVELVEFCVFYAVWNNI